MPTEKPLIYQMLPRLWGNMTPAPEKGGDLQTNGCGKFSSIDAQTLSHIRSLGMTHVWYTGIIRHATATSTHGCVPSNPQWVKGKAGSPYSITDYFDTNPYLADDPSRRMEEFEDLVRRTHEAGLGVVIDFVPNHVARDYGAFSPAPISGGRDALGHPVLGAGDDRSLHWTEENDFFYYPGQALTLPVPPVEGFPPYAENPAKASGNCYAPSPGVNDWFDTVKINYCDFPTSTWNKMEEALLFWASKGVDAFRCDMVELVPQDFCAWLIRKVKERFPDVLFIAEVYQKHLYDKYIHEVGFDMLYDKSGLYDALHDILVKNANDTGVTVASWQSTERITWNWQSLGGLQPYMLNFLENHDEQRLASDFFIGDPRKAFAALHVAVLLNTAPFMLYSGQEVGERGMQTEGMSGVDGRTSIFDWWSVPSLRRLYSTIHGGIPGSPALTDDERALLDKYRELLNFARSCDAVRRGTTYDLCYCNLSSDGFNKERHFVFLRSSQGKDSLGGETILVACNFSSSKARMSICIPAHAFDWMGIRKTQTLNPSTPITVEVEPYDGTVMKIQ